MNVERHGGRDRRGIDARQRAKRSSSRVAKSRRPGPPASARLKSYAASSTPSRLNPGSASRVS